MLYFSQEEQIMDLKQPNHRLSTLMQQAGMTNKGLAKRMEDFSKADGGEPIAPSHTNVDKWLSGATSRPKARTCEVLAGVLGIALGRQVTTADLGYGETEPHVGTIPPDPVDKASDLPVSAALGHEDAGRELPLVEQKAVTKGGYVHNRNRGNVTGTVIQAGEIHGNISL